MSKSQKSKAAAKNTGKIKVRVIQAHEETLPGEGFVRRAVDDEIEIETKKFAANIHQKIPASASKEATAGGSTDKED